MAIVNYSVQEEVAFIHLNSPPSNLLGYKLRQAIGEGLEQAVNDEKVKVIVLLGDEVFSWGADISEFGTPAMFLEPNLRTLIRLLERSPKPTIAALSGTTFGGGFELALGCHYRVAKSDASVALPEVKLGIIPGAGGTQRLPRLVGPEVALNMIVSGQTVPTVLLATTALFDNMVMGDLKEGALAFAKKLIAKGSPVRPVADIEIHMPLSEAYFQFARKGVKAKSRGFSAPLKALASVEAAITKPFYEGIEFEEEIFAGLAFSAESASLRHIFFSERSTSKIPEITSDTPVRSIDKISVIGAGSMGSGISMNFLSVGLPVTLIDTTQEALDRGVATIKRNYEETARKGKMKPAEVEKAIGLLKTSLSVEDVNEADLIIEAVFEDMALKKEIFKKLDFYAKPGAILATNTSTLNLNEIAQVTSRPQDVIGLHFFNPANVMKLLEIVRGAQTGKDILATALQLTKKIKKIGIVAGVCDGFIGNRMIASYIRASRGLLEEGASPNQIDKALETWGMAMGPYRMMDLSGNDIGWMIRKRYYQENPSLRKDLIADRLCEMGRFGQKTGSGWYRYEANQKDPLPDPIVEELIAQSRRELGITPRQIKDAEIIERCIYALINEGSKILQESIALRASDIDIAYIYGYGFPPTRGGPMHYADQVSLFAIAQRLSQFATEANEDDKEFWKPSSLIKDLIKQSKNFSQFDKGAS